MISPGPSCHLTTAMTKRAPLPFLTRLLSWAIPLTTLAMPFAVACDPGDPDAEVRALIEESIDLANETVDVFCDCWEEFGEPSRSECLGDQVLPAQRRCIEDAYLRDAEASKLRLECTTKLLGEYRDCLDAKLECSDAGPANACGQDLDIGVQECIELPNSVERALGDCSAGSGPAASGGGGDEGGTGWSDEGGDGDGGCQWTNDGVCDEPEGLDVCPEGTDVDDCADWDGDTGDESGWGDAEGGSDPGGATTG